MGVASSCPENPEPSTYCENVTDWDANKQKCVYGVDTAFTMDTVPCPTLDCPQCPKKPNCPQCPEKPNCPVVDCPKCPNVSSQLTSSELTSSADLFPVTRDIPSYTAYDFNCETNSGNTGCKSMGGKLKLDGIEYKRSQANSAFYNNVPADVCKRLCDKHSECAAYMLKNVTDDDKTGLNRCFLKVQNDDIKDLTKSKDLILSGDLSKPQFVTYVKN